MRIIRQTPSEQVTPNAAATEQVGAAHAPAPNEALTRDIASRVAPTGSTPTRRERHRLAAQASAPAISMEQRRLELPISHEHAPARPGPCAEMIDLLPAAEPEPAAPEYVIPGAPSDFTPAYEYQSVASETPGYRINDLTSFTSSVPVVDHVPAAEYAPIASDTDAGAQHSADLVLPSRRSLHQHPSQRRKRATWQPLVVVASVLAVAVAGVTYLGDRSVGTVEFLSGPAEGAVVTDSRVNMTVKAARSSEYACKIDGGGWRSCPSTVDIEGLDDGQHQVTVRGVNGRAVGQPASRTFVVQTGTPSVTITQGPANGAVVNGSELTVAFTAPGSPSFECRADQSPWVQCGSPHTFTNLTPGRHSIAVRTTAEGAKPDLRTFSVVDPNAPVDPQADVVVMPTDPILGNPAMPTTPVGGWPTPKPGESGPGRPTVTPTVGPLQPGPTKTPTPQPTPRPVQTPPPGGSYGVPAGTKLRVHEGDLTVTEAGAVIDGLDIKGFLRIKAPNVTVRRTIIRGSSTQPGPLVISTSPGVLIEDSELSPVLRHTNTNGVYGHGFTLNRLNIHDVIDGVHIYGDNVNVFNSWIHRHLHFDRDPNHGNTASHDDGIQLVSGNNIVVHRNYIDGSYNAAIMLGQDRAKISNMTVTNNFLGGGGCTVNIAEKGKGPLQGIVIRDNRFGTQREKDCAVVAPPSSPIQLSGNVFESNGQPVRMRSGR